MKSLETYLNKARSAKSATPVVSHIELRSIVESVASGSVQTPPRVPHSLTLLQKGIIMASVLCAVAVGACLWLTPATEPSISAQTVPTTTSKQKATTIQTNTTTTTNTGKQQSPVVVRGVQLSKSGTAIQPTASTPTPVMFLSKEELQALEITQNSDEFQAVIEEQFNEKDAPPQAKLLLNTLGYPLDVTPLILRANVTVKPNSSSTEAIEYNPKWDVTKPKGFAPFVCAYYTSEGEGSVSVSMSTTDHTPYVASQDVARELSREFHQLMKDMSSSDEQDIFVRKSIPMNKRDYQYVKYLVPVAVDVSDKQTKKIALFYYIPTASFVRALSPKHQQLLAYLTPMLAENMLNIEYRGVSAVVDEEKIPTPSTIAGIEYLSLTNDELKELGINANGSSADFVMDKFTQNENELPQATNQDEVRKQQRYSVVLAKQKAELRDKYGYTTDVPSVLFRNTIHATLGSTDCSKLMPYSGWDYTNYNPLSPVGYTIRDHKLSREERFGTIEASVQICQNIVGNSPLLNGKSKNFTANTPDGTVINTGSTIPVRIMLGTVHDAQPNSVQPKAGADSANYHVQMVDVFFVPNREFVERLPDRYRKPLMEELNMMECVIKGEIPLGQACEQLHKTQASSILSMCNIPQGTIREVNTFPNPTAGGITTCSFSATEGGAYNISLYNVTGTLAHNLLQTTFAKGYNTITLPLKEVGAGVYLLTIASTKGIQATHRIIIQ